MSTPRDLGKKAEADGGEVCCGKPAGRAKGNERHFANLMRSAQDGDASAYVNLLTEVTALLRGAVRRRHRFLTPQDVEDIVQDVLLSLHTARASYDPERPFFPWLMAITRNRTADALRRRVRRSANEVAVESYDETFSTVDANTSEETYRDPEALRQAIRQLPQRQRRAIEMLKLHEMSLKQAAAASGMSIGALKVAVYRAIRGLHAALGEES